MGKLCSGRVCVLTEQNVIFAAYFLLRDHDTHIDFLRLLFQVIMIYPLMQYNFFPLFWNVKSFIAAK